MIIASDIFGWHLSNNREVCDWLAHNNLIGVLPDLFHGDEFVSKMLADVSPTAPDSMHYRVTAAKC